MINEQLLLEHGASLKKVSKGAILFNKGDRALFYYQVKTGEIKMNNYNEEGKEFIQGIFYSGQSFGEPPLFVDVDYPAGAEAIVDSEIYKLKQSDFFHLLRKHPAMHFKVTEVLSGRLYYKAVMASEISSQEPEHRLLKLFDHLKEHVHRLNKADEFEVDLTRQKMADLTGLRVETVIRACKSLAKKGEIRIVKRKIVR